MLPGQASQRAAAEALNFECEGSATAFPFRFHAAGEREHALRVEHTHMRKGQRAVREAAAHDRSGAGDWGQANMHHTTPFDSSASCTLASASAHLSSGMALKLAKPMPSAMGLAAVASALCSFSTAACRSA